LVLKKVLVALDGSKNSGRALEMAIYLARQGNTKLTGILVLPPKPKKEYQKLPYPEKPMLEAADKIMEESRLLCAQNGILFEKKISFGLAGPAIVKFAKSLNYDIIVIGSRGMSGLKELFLGSVSHYIVHKSPIPVMIIK